MMTKQKLLNDIQKAIQEYEEAHKEFIGVDVFLPTSNRSLIDEVYSWNGDSFVKKE